MSNTFLFSNDINDINECTELIYDSFTNDPYSWSKSVNLSFEYLKRWIKDYLINISSYPYIKSIVCKNNYKINGSCIIEDFNYSPNENNPENKAIKYMVDLCTSLFWNYVSKYNLNISKDKGVIAYIAFIAVDKDFRRKNIGDLLLKTSTLLLKEKDYKYSIAYCTSYRSRYLFEKNGYKYIGGINYQDFSMPDGSKPYLSIPKDECSVMFLEL
jgi:ribosomal protein S18 acetylase RimI-like enzyme